ncbi:hypothetical protein BCR41DRAFT_322178 [Lobosporangium transversale]|uniref:RING-type domain-containing protein n=1 Tax=Lobosporangium transversale TaxID=64571 RepID=A0A1Y2GQR1_9FUNG|nr:hypothetical protein BCR41DRAFT_322178 [Lobosporangium transversale]ORZ16666.1 hypothetical protein BCR41DRAFT_322178 [Lobosporangium transversale]|eukprot:XP_021881601.1 hypothetical protein BCR41DRAFT_322178 [Lobosporangium transversale]
MAATGSVYRNNSNIDSSNNGSSNNNSGSSNTTNYNETKDLPISFSATLTEEALYDPRGLQYVEPTQTSLQCSVCCEYFTEPVSAPCGHTFCRACILQALEVRNGCPLCRTKIDPAMLYEVIALSRICDELLVYCPHKELGCNHTCQRIQIGQHLKDDCVYIGTLCREHHKTCPAESVTCPHCETTRARLRHLEHIKTCPQQIIPCTLSEFGCPWKGPRFDLEAIHIPQCPYEAIRGFLELSKSKMEALEQENQHLRGIFHDLRPQVQQLRDQVGQIQESLQLIAEQEQEQAAGSNINNSGGGISFGTLGGFMDMNYHQYQHRPQFSPRIDRRESYDLVSVNGVDNEMEMERQRASTMNRNNSIGAESMMSSGAGAGGVMTPGNAAEAHELLISENERIRSEIETLTAGLASLELKQNMAIMTESMRIQEEVQSLRAVCHGLRMQMHYLLLEQQNLRHHPGPPPPPGSPAGAVGGNQPGLKGSVNGGPSGDSTANGRSLSVSGPPRPRLSDGLGRQDTKL